MRSESGELASDLTRRDSDSSSWSDGSHCSLSSLTDARQVAFIRKARDVPGRAVSMPEALAYDNARCGSNPRCMRPHTAVMGQQQNIILYWPGDKSCNA